MTENTWNVPRPPNLSQPNRTAPTFIGSTHWPASTQMKFLLASPPLTKNISWACCRNYLRWLKPKSAIASAFSGHGFQTTASLSLTTDSCKYWIYVITKISPSARESDRSGTSSPVHNNLTLTTTLEKGISSHISTFTAFVRIVTSTTVKYYLAEFKPFCPYLTVFFFKQKNVKYILK